ncbi:MAG TPA: hypothetical protein VED87_06140, partial [Methylocystis sp.]|nr:hypothetical protein [Methylocystis sp.]
MSPTLSRLALFFRDRRATALVEFAWLWPILVLTMYGAYNLSRMAHTARQLSRLSDDIAQMIVTIPASNSSSAKGTQWCTVTSYTIGSATITPTCAALEDYNLWYAHDSTMVEFPQVLQDSGASWGSDISVSITGIALAPSSTACIGSSNSSCYAAYVAWYAQNGTGAAKRTCSTVFASTADTAAQSSTTLPTDVFDPVPIPSSSTGNPSSTYAPPLFQVVVDVTYTWKPSNWQSSLGWLPNFTITRSSYLN